MLEAAAKNESRCRVARISNGGAQFFAGQGLADVDEARVLGAVAFARHVHLAAEAHGGCVVLHTDHAAPQAYSVGRKVDWVF